MSVKASLKKIYKALSGQESKSNTIVGIIDDISEYLKNRR